MLVLAMSIADYRAVLQFSLVMLCAGCERTGVADETETGGGDPTPLTQAEFVSRFRTLSCQNLQRCCTASGLALDESTCPALFANAGLGTVGTTYDPASGTQCIAEIEASTQCWMRPGGDACSRVYSGARALGEPCTAPSDCASTPGGTAVCDEVRWICTVAMHGQLGDVCQRSCWLDNGQARCDWGPASNPTASGSTVDCFASDGLACGNAGRCAALAGRGQPCENHSSCDRSLYCMSLAGGATPTCQSRGTIGSPCDPFNAPCVDSAYCSAAGCVAKKANGQPCLTNVECSGGVCLCGIDGCATPGVCTDPNTIQNNVDVFAVVTSYCHG